MSVPREPSVTTGVLALVLTCVALTATGAALSQSGEAGLAYAFFGVILSAAFAIAGLVVSTVGLRRRARPRWMLVFGLVADSLVIGFAAFVVLGVLAVGIYLGSQYAG